MELLVLSFYWVYALFEHPAHIIFHSCFKLHLIPRHTIETTSNLIY